MFVFCYHNNYVSISKLTRVPVFYNSETQDNAQSTSSIYAGASGHESGVDPHYAAASDDTSRRPQRDSLPRGAGSTSYGGTGAVKLDDNLYVENRDVNA